MVMNYIYTTHANYEAEVARLITTYADSLKVKIIGQSQEERNINLITVGNGKPKVFVYGFPHPDENICAGTIIKMLESLGKNRGILQGIDAAWFIIPSIDIDLAYLNDLAHDNNDASRAANPLKPYIEEIDFSMLNPRPETLILKTAIEKAKPDIVITLHDQAHWTGYEPSYIILNPFIDCDSHTIDSILFPSGRPKEHKTIVAVNMPKSQRENAMFSHIEKRFPNYRTIWPEVNAIKYNKFSKLKLPKSFNKKYYLDWVNELQNCFPKKIQFLGHAYEKVLTHRYRFLKEHQLKTLLKQAQQISAGSNPSELINLHADLLTGSYFINLAHSINKDIALLSIPVHERGPLPKEYMDKDLLYSYQELVEQQFQVILHLILKELNVQKHSS